MSVRSRRRRGGGTVFYDEDRGRYVGQVSYLDEAGRRHRPKVYAKTAEACWEKLDELRRELKKSGSVAPRDLTGRGRARRLARPPSGRLEVAAHPRQPEEPRGPDQPARWARRSWPG